MTESLPLDLPLLGATSLVVVYTLLERSSSYGSYR